MNSGDVCFYCDNSATCWCDGILCFVAVKNNSGDLVIDTSLLEKPDPVFGHDPAVRCSRPLCEDCTTERSAGYFMCGTNEEGERWFDSDTFDFCRDCSSDQPGSDILLPRETALVLLRRQLLRIAR